MGSEDTKVKLRRRATDRPLSNAPPPINNRVEAVLNLMRHFAEPVDHGYCGQKGRVITAKVDTRAGYIIMSFSHEKDRYEVTYAVHVKQCEPMDVFHSSFRVATSLRERPTFTPQDTEHVFASLDAIFGVKK
jgi:hypothetical protein